MTGPGSQDHDDHVPSLDELDARTLTRLLRSSGQGLAARPVIAVRAEPVGAATGFLGSLRRLHLTYDGSSDADANGDGDGDGAAEADPEPGGRPPATHPDRLVAKAPTTDAGGRQVGQMLNVWYREHRFFAELAARLPVRAPHCYANLAEHATDRWLLLLADAGDTTAASQHHGATPDEAAAALEEIARLHRHVEELQRGGARLADWLPGFDRGPMSMLQAAVESAVAPFLARFGDLLPNGGADLLRRFAPLLSAWAAARSQEPLTLVHADYRLDNLIIDAAGTVTVLDWQTALLGPGAMDVASLLATSLTLADRRAHEDELLEVYAAASGHTVADVRLGVRHHLLWWMALYANNLSRIDPTDPKGQAMFEDTVQRTFCAALEHEAGRLLDD